MVKMSLIIIKHNGINKKLQSFVENGMKIKPIVNQHVFRELAICV